MYICLLPSELSLQLKILPKNIYKNKCCEDEIDTVFNSPCLFTSNALIQFKQPMLVYEDYFNAGVSMYISHIVIFTFATYTPHPTPPPFPPHPPPFDTHYQMSPSSFSIAMSFNCDFGISAAVRFGRNSVADGFNSFFFSSLFVGLIPSQCNSNSKTFCLCFSGCVFL